MKPTLTCQQSATAMRRAIFVFLIAAAAYLYFVPPDEAALESAFPTVQMIVKNLTHIFSTIASEEHL